MFLCWYGPNPKKLAPHKLAAAVDRYVEIVSPERITPWRDPMYLSVYDPDKKKSAVAKLLEAVNQYQTKFGHTPTVCLVNPYHADDLAQITEPAIRVVPFVPRCTFYVGVEDDPAEVRSSTTPG